VARDADTRARLTAEAMLLARALSKESARAAVCRGYRPVDRAQLPDRSLTTHSASCRCAHPSPTCCCQPGAPCRVLQAERPCRQATEPRKSISHTDRDRSVPRLPTEHRVFIPPREVSAAHAVTLPGRSRFARRHHADWIRLVRVTTEVMSPPGASSQGFPRASAPSPSPGCPSPRGLCHLRASSHSLPHRGATCRPRAPKPSRMRSGPNASSSFPKTDAMHHRCLSTGAHPRVHPCRVWPCRQRRSIAR
jgi:hypothetical protein